MLKGGRARLHRVAADAGYEAERITPDVVDGHRNDCPSAFPQPGSLKAVMQQGIATQMPFHAVVFGDHHCVRPCEVEAPQSTMSIEDAELELRASAVRCR
ncbi:hypothetical protein MSAS_20510 [Mycobacterium saskatchewanense]|nr:hypothetical protein MSAS_20510 [Mycobacterium saskatchewanense]